MGSRVPCHHLNNGLYVSGRPGQPKERFSTTSSMHVPYTGGDIKRLKGLGKVFDLPIDRSKYRKSCPMDALTRTSSFCEAVYYSGPMNPNATTSSNYSTLPLFVGRLIIVSFCSIGVLFPWKSCWERKVVGYNTSYRNSSRVLRKISGPLDSSRSLKMHGSSLINNQGVITLGQDDEYSITTNIPKPILYALIVLFVIGFIAGGYVLEPIHNSILLVVVIILFCIVGGLFMWNSCWGRKAAVSYIESYPNSELRTAEIG